MVQAIKIPIGEPLTFERLKELNADVSPEELAEVFPQLPAVLREQAWDDMRLRVALDSWGELRLGDDS